MKQFTFHFISFFLITFLNACSNRDKQINLEDTTKVYKETVQEETIRDIGDYKLALLDSKLDKMYDVLGQPDNKGRSATGDNQHFIYYNKVKENGILKHLVVFSSYNPYKDSFIPISQIEAVSDGEQVSLGRYGIITVKKPAIIKSYFSDGESKALIDSVDKTVKELDTNMITPIYEGTLYNHRWKENVKLYYYTDTHTQSYILIKDVLPLSGNGYQVTRYLFADNNLKYIDEQDITRSIPQTKLYVKNNKSVRYLVNDKIVPCIASQSEYSTGCNCSFTEDSYPYFFYHRVLTAAQDQQKQLSRQ